MYIIPITIISVVILLLTTHRSKKKVENNGKARFFDGESVVNVVQQLVIVFLSAMLAMWLTEYLEKKNTVEHVEAFASSMYLDYTGQLSNIHMDIKEVADLENEAEKGTDEQLLKIAKAVASNENSFFENMRYNDDFVTTLSPTSFMVLSIDFENMNRISNELKEVNAENLDRQKVSEQIADYLFYLSDAAFSFGLLRVDAEYDFVNLFFADQSLIEQDTIYTIYNMDIKFLQESFDVDLKDWENKRKYNT